MRYRADIDGLRAVSVLLVLGFHAGVPWLGGGFVGVDVFFVISGFLIAGLIGAEQAEGRFSLLRFWERRARRILPALFLVLAATLALAWFIDLPRDLLGVAKANGAAVISAANLHYWRTYSYFIGVGLDRPLLHTWSLGVEEQFYLLFPLGMAAIAAWFPTRRIAILGVVAALSLALSAWAAEAAPVAGFYLPVTRAWELLAGALLALWPRLQTTPDRAKPWIGLLGLALIVGSALVFSDATPFPGIAALAPCLGAALVIAAGGAGWTGRLLSLPPVVGLGLVSYSLYLWHWPLLSFQRITALGGQSPLAIAGTLLTALALAIVTWTFVERPFRDRARLSTRPAMVALAGAALLLLGATVGIIASAGAPGRFAPDALAMDHWLGRPPRAAYRMGTCFVSSDVDFEQYSRAECLTRDPARPDWLLVGDSHGAHLWRGLSTASPDVNVMQATVTGCRLLPRDKGARRSACRRMVRLVWDETLANDRPDGVILSARWRDGDVDDVADAIDRLKAAGVPVLLVGPQVQYDDSLPRILALSRKLHDPGLADRRRRPGPEALDRRMAAMARGKGVAYVSMFDLLCQDGRCVTLTPEGAPMAHDYGHLTAEGSVVVGRRLRERGLFPPR